MRPPEARPLRPPWWLLGLVLYSVLAVVLFSSTWFAGRSSWIGFGGDPAIFAWMLRWSPFALSHHLNPLSTTYLNYPAGVNLMWNSSIPAVAALMTPVTLTAGAVPAYNFLETAALVVSAMAAYGAIREFVDSPPAALVGGLIYGFSPFMVGQSEGHPNVTLAFFPPLVLVLLHRIVVRRQQPYRAALLLGVAGALQLLTSEEVLAATAIVAGLGLVLLGILHPGRVARAGRAAAGPMAVAAVVALALSAYPLYHQLRGAQRVTGQLQPTDTFVSDLYSFVVPGRLMLLQTGATRALFDHFTGNFVENGSYIGLPLLVLAMLVVVRRWRDPVARYFGLLAALGMVLSLGPHLHVAGTVMKAIPLPWLAVQSIPLMENALPVRYIMFTNLALGILVATALKRARPRREVASVAWVAGVAVAVLTLLPALPFNTTVAPTPSFFHGAVARIPAGSTVVVLPFTDATTPMLSQEESGFRYRMPEGHVYIPGPYNGSGPSAMWQELAYVDAGYPGSPRTAALREALRADLARWKVRAVVVDWYPRAPQAVALMEWVIGSPPESVEGVLVWWDPLATGAAPQA